MKLNKKFKEIHEELHQNSRYDFSDSKDVGILKKSKNKAREEELEIISEASEKNADDKISSTQKKLEDLDE